MVATMLCHVTRGIVRSQGWQSDKLEVISFSEYHLLSCVEGNVIVKLLRTYLLEYMALNKREGELFKKDFLKL